MKPRLRFVHGVNDVAGHYWYWTCSDSRVSLVGSTPKIAYDIWLHEVQKLYKMESPQTKGTDHATYYDFVNCPCQRACSVCLRWLRCEG
jgi:hypothetical protein